MWVGSGVNYFIFYLYATSQSHTVPHYFCSPFQELLNGLPTIKREEELKINTVLVRKWSKVSRNKSILVLQATLPVEAFPAVPSEPQILISARSLHNVSETEPLLELWQEQSLLYLDLLWASPVSDVLLEENTQNELSCSGSIGNVAPLDMFNPSPTLNPNSFKNLSLISSISSRSLLCFRVRKAQLVSAKRIFNQICSLFYIKPLSGELVILPCALITTVLAEAKHSPHLVWSAEFHCPLQY